ncbi:Lysyl-tRNA synthetase [Alteracholeplasma palmae J233]|uniref:Lysine--tRNA ligase n=1 Tax=Alteracholeplasma palmae (strain ATCC 49389 / J233) TaxID=1318466 RepID=U4KSG0_ALTPJ|nr:lysine--tRNA ligase [Alteracholeplasma palmae]CCV64976.1 Lysyl-tRNA synthetase [Alteracholeplasma palmae J233]
MYPDDFNEQQLIRRKKVEELKELGVDPFGKKYQRTHTTKQIIETYGNDDHDTLEEKHVEVSVAGRIVLKRVQGKAGFMHLQDRDGKIQAYVRLDGVGELSFDLYKRADLGDIVGIKGILFRTKTDELTIKATEFTHLTKALRPLPDKFHGLQDKEEARRRRYVDLIVNEEAQFVAKTRPRIIRAIQHFFDSKGFIEVETPVLHSILGGAAARPFVTHHNALDMDFYLRIATELPLKRLIVGGLEAVYEIGRLFRNEGIDATHNPEFTTIEAYLAYADMEDIMDLVENCLSTVTHEVLGTYDVTYGENTIHMKDFKRVHMVDLIKELSGVDFWQQMSLDEAKDLAKKHEIKIEKHFSIGHIIEAFYEKYGEPSIIQPTMVYGHPVEISPLAKKNEKDPRFTDRFELFIAGKEYANAFSELNDPIDQKERFLHQLEQKALGDDEASEMDIDFVEALEYGMPPTGGLGIGIDRLIMLLTNTPNIRDVILFPHARRK